MSDTQTGLRGIPEVLFSPLLDIKENGYEFEMKMLIISKNYKIDISEVTIETVYINDNESSHFNPIIDSIKIYSTFLKFGLSSVASFVADIILFAILTYFLVHLFPDSFIIVSTVGARVLSSLLNYTINRVAVFQSQSKGSIIKYFILSIIIMITSAVTVHFIYGLIGSSEITIKIIVDGLLFLISYISQKKWVFKDYTKA